MPPTNQSSAQYSWVLRLTVVTSIRFKFFSCYVFRSCSRTIHGLNCLFVPSNL
jgi:hypothetical protein